MRRSVISVWVEEKRSAEHWCEASTLISVKRRDEIRARNSQEEAIITRQKTSRRLELASLLDISRSSAQILKKKHFRRRVVKSALFNARLETEYWFRFGNLSEWKIASFFSPSCTRAVCVFFFSLNHPFKKKWRVWRHRIGISSRGSVSFCLVWFRVGFVYFAAMPRLLFHTFPSFYATTGGSILPRMNTIYISAAAKNYLCNCFLKRKINEVHFREEQITSNRVLFRKRKL